MIFNYYALMPNLASELSLFLQQIFHYLEAFEIFFFLFLWNYPRYLKFTGIAIPLP